jgi:DNA-binding LacI/PurR family transcriptional regulator
MLAPKNTNLKYKLVEDRVRQLVANSRVGDKLPTERELAKLLDCNVLTVRKGMQALVDEKWLSRRVGSGTFVERVPEGPQDGDSFAADYIGIVNHSDGGLYSYRLAEAIAQEALKQGVEVRLVWTEDYGDSLLESVKDMARNGCRSLIFPWFPSSYVDSVRNFVAESPLKPVLPQRVSGLGYLCFEEPDVYGKSAVVEIEALYEYFHQLGADRIHFIGPNAANSPIFQEKTSAFVCCAAKSGREPVFGLFGSPEQALELARKYKQYAGDLAIISYDDTHAVRFMTAMHKLGLFAPDDFCIIGHNESSAARNAEPPLSTIRENFEYIGKAMLATAQGLAAGTCVQSSRSPNPKLVVRMSCGGRDRAADLNVKNLDVEIDSLPDFQRAAEPAVGV